MITVAVGIGLILNFLFLELLGLSPGGIVVPGFMALEMHYPQRVILTVVISIITYFTIKLLSNFMLIYGRRHLVIAVLIGFLLSEIFSKASIAFDFRFKFQIIGFILPGLMAYWMDRQGPIRTLSAMVIGATIIHLILIIITGGKFAI